MSGPLCFELAQGSSTEKLHRATAKRLDSVDSGIS